MTIISNSHFRNADANGAFILADSQLIIENSLVTPYVSGASCRWIDATNEFSAATGRTSVSLNRCRFGPEQSGGIPVIYSSISGDTAQGQRTTVAHISMQDCYSGSANSATPRALIVLQSNSGATATIAPNLIRISGGSWNANNGAVVTQAGLTTGYNPGQFVIDIDATGQAGFGSSSTAPSRVLVEDILEKFVAQWHIENPSVTTTGSFTYSVGNKTFVRFAPASAATLTDFTDALDGHEVTLLCANSNLTVADRSTTGNFELAGSVDFVSTADDTLTVIYNRVTGRWFEKSRSVN
jgi:hypothetical protein